MNVITRKKKEDTPGYETVLVFVSDIVQQKRQQQKSLLFLKILLR
jgi:hypothetical protein